VVLVARFAVPGLSVDRLRIRNAREFGVHLARWPGEKPTYRSVIRLAMSLK
jgi:hypothetical protein